MTRKPIQKKKSRSQKKLLSIKEDLFCHFYVQNNDLRGNATHSYAAAFAYDLDSLPQDDAQYEEVENRLVCISKSSYDRAANVCAVEGRRLLRKPQIQARMMALYNSLLDDSVIDGKLAEHIMQNEDRGVSIAGIREYNKLRGRIIDKKSLTDAEGNAVPIVSLTIHAPASDEKN